MPLTAAQLLTLHNDMTTNAATVTNAGATNPISTIASTPSLQTPDWAFAVAAWYSSATNPAYYVVCTNASVEAINNAINLFKFTPNPAVTGTNAAQAGANAGYIQIKLWNLDRLIGRPNQTIFDATKANNVKSLNDAVTNLPAGASFALIDGGWGTPTTGVMTTLSRVALNIEKLFANVAGQAAQTLVPTLYDGASAQGAQGNPSVMLYEGSILYTDVEAAWVA